MDSEIRVVDNREKKPEKTEMAETEKPARKLSGGPKWWIKFKSIKHYEFIIAAVLIAILLLVYVAVSTSGDSKSTVATSTSDEQFAQKVEQVLTEIEGVGKVKVLITYKDAETEVSSSGNEFVTPAIEGVVVVAQGGDDSKVKFHIIKAIQTALGVDAAKIQVFTMK